MEIPEGIRIAAERLKRGQRVNRRTVRDFLRLFGVARRGAVKVQEIRDVLERCDLVTEPDFETVWIDAPIRLKLKSGVAVTSPVIVGEPSVPALADEVEESVLEEALSADELAEEQTESAPASAQPEPYSIADQADAPKKGDPTFRIGSLPAANKELVTVNPNDGLVKAVTLMLEYDFSQLPIMQNERDVKGVVTWKTIGRILALGTQCDSVGDCCQDANIVDSNRTFFDAIPMIVEHGYVLVRAGDRRITGIVTAGDLILRFRELTEPFLLLREIELQLRDLLKDKVVAADFDVLDDGNPFARRPQNIADLTFGDYLRLFQHPQIWPKLALKIDRVVLINLLEAVRLIRNDVMHFDEDPLTGDEINTLKRAVNFLREMRLS
jgi:CBS domain-containing protein